MSKSNDKELERNNSDKKSAEGKKAKAIDKNKKPNVLVRMGRKLTETFSELKRVTWPSWGKALKATGVVLVIVLVFTVAVTLVNVGFTELLKLLTEAGA